MVAVRAQNANAFVAKPDSAVRAFVFYGTDPGLISERAKKLADTLAARETPPGEIVRLDDTDLDNDPDRLAVELLTVAMFGGAKIVRTVASRKVTAQSIKPLLEGSSLPGVLIVEAGNLKADEGFRALFEKSTMAAAIGCYPDEQGSLTVLVGEVLGQAKLSITPEAREELINRLGADRAMSRGEVEKLVLYAQGAPTITLEHIEAIVGDASEMAIDRVINAAASGDAVTAIAECDRAVAAGESPQLVILMVQRHFVRLHRVRTALDGGRSLDDVMRQIRPPLFGKTRAEVERQSRIWSARQLDQALARIGATAKSARLASAIETVLAERLLLEIARIGRQGQNAARSS